MTNCKEEESKVNKTKMVLDIESLKKQYSDLDNRELRWDEACEVCELPKLVHTADMRCRKIPDLQIDAAWKGIRM